LLRVFEDLCRLADSNRGGEACYAEAQVGIVGYPNVGKSSVINVLIGATPLNHQSKRVATGATPGKTKHFQTIELPPLDGINGQEPFAMTLCDCPGLVFPQFVSSSAEMLHAGVLNVTQLRDHIPPMRLLCERIPRAVFELTYGFIAPRVGSEGLESAAEMNSLIAATNAASIAATPEEAKLSQFLTVESTLVGIGKARSWYSVSVHLKCL
jgi:ribosome biogenesis GTPase A